MTRAVQRPTTKHAASGRTARSSARRLFDVEDVAQNYLEPFSVDRFNQKRMVLGEPPGVTPLTGLHPHVAPVGCTGRGLSLGTDFHCFSRLGANATEWRGLLAKEASFRLIVSGEVGVKEIERLIQKLEIDKEILADQEDTQELVDASGPVE
jgi:hypothetical protein